MTDPNTNARYVDLGGGKIGELISHQVQFFYDPTTQRARVIFNGHVYLQTGEVWRKVGEDNDILEVDVSNLLAMRPVQTELRDPVTGIDLSDVSIAGFQYIMKAAYDLFVNQRAIQRQMLAQETETLNDAPLNPKAPVVQD